MDPIASPSGFSWEEISTRLASPISPSIVSSSLPTRNPSQYLIDPVARLERLVEAEFNVRYLSHPDLLREPAANEAL